MSSADCLSDVQSEIETDLDRPSITRDRLLGRVPTRTTTVKTSTEPSQDMLQFCLRDAVAKGDLPRVSEYLLRGAKISADDPFMLSLAPDAKMKAFVSKQASQYVALLDTVRTCATFEECRTALLAKGRRAKFDNFGLGDEHMYQVVRYAVQTGTLRLVETCFVLTMQFYHLRIGAGSDEILTVRLTDTSADSSDDPSDDPSDRSSKRVCV